MCQNGAHETYMFSPVRFQEELPSPVGRSRSEIPCARPEPKQPVAGQGGASARAGSNNRGSNYLVAGTKR